MEKNEYFEAFSELFLLNGLEKPSEELTGQFYKLSDLLLSANKIHNLTAIKDDEGVMVKHFIDSIFISDLLPNGASVVDVGCGPGFPSLPIAIYRKDLNVLGIDSTTKKINFVNDTSKALGLDNLEAISARAEDMAHKVGFRECFDVATARAVASLDVLCELCLPFVKVGGLFIAMKAQSADEELEKSRSAILKCGGEYVETKIKRLCYRGDNSLPENRSLIIIKKIKNTPDIYPRHYSKITKKPL